MRPLSARLIVEVHRSGQWAFAVGGYMPMGRLLDLVPQTPVPVVIEVSLNDDKPRVLQ
jgi:hypothetical protein